MCVVLVLQVFRTYNASITLDRLLFEMEEGGGVGHHGQSYCSRTLEAKKADYDRANKEVRPRLGAVICARLAGVLMGTFPGDVLLGWVCCALGLRCSTAVHLMFCGVDEAPCVSAEPGCPVLVCFRRRLLSCVTISALCPRRTRRPWPRRLRS
jgi:hypothetical protein